MLGPWYHQKLVPPHQTTWLRFTARVKDLLEYSTMVEDEFNPFGTAVPFWGQTTQFSSSLSPKRDCGSKGVNWTRGAKDVRQLLFIYFFKPSFFLLRELPLSSTFLCVSWWKECFDYFFFYMYTYAYAERLLRGAIVNRTKYW